MIKWTNRNLAKFREVLLACYTTNRELRRLVSDNLVYSLNNVPDAVGTSREDWAEDLLNVAASAIWIDELYQLFCSVHKDDPRIVQLKRDLQDSSLTRTIGEPQTSNSVIRREIEGELIEDPNSAHLVIAVFWQKPSEEMIRIRPKFCYRDPNNCEILREDLSKEENYSITLKDFPEFLTKIVSFTISTKISKYFLNSLDPWQLTIELFVPVDLLCKPLEAWCGKNEELMKNRSIVVGCSDRFNPDQPDTAVNLHNQLKLGWKRFQEKIPDQASQKLKNLDWLTSTNAKTESFAAYSGFQCYGDWLKPGEDHHKNWLELVRSGIPLALWMCKGKPDSSEISKIFDYLVESTRFEFLERIRMLRDQHLKTCDHCLGVFYEDPNYVPDALLPPSEQLFVWPGA
jgi:hypothetical protein